MVTLYMAAFWLDYLSDNPLHVDVQVLRGYYTTLLSSSQGLDRVQSTMMLHSISGALDPDYCDDDRSGTCAKRQPLGEAAFAKHNLFASRHRN